MAGRGTHKDDMGSPNNVKPLARQGEPGGGRGTHDDGFRQSVARPKTVTKYSVPDQVTNFHGSADETIEFGKQDPVRSHK